MMKRHNLFFRIEELTHGNINKTNRIVHSLQGRFEHGRVVLNEGDWNIQFVDELMQFPSPLTHDDMIDALSYIDQLAHVAYSGNFEQHDDWEPYDSVAGY
jgi:phage terminase large subunit-like protein